MDKFDVRASSWRSEEIKNENPCPILSSQALSNEALPEIISQYLCGMLNVGMVLYWSPCLLLLLCARILSKKLRLHWQLSRKSSCCVPISKYDLSMITIYYAGIVWLYCIVLYCDLVQSTRKIKRCAFKHAASCLILY